MQDELVVQATSSGDVQPTGKDDILTQALGTPEHGGRVRASSWLASHGDYWGKRPSQHEENIMLKRQLMEMSLFFQKFQQWQHQHAQTIPGFQPMDMSCFTTIARKILIHCFVKTLEINSYV